MLGTDYVEFYVGNAKQSAFYYQSAFGFELVAYMGLETGSKDVCSYVLQQGKIRLVLTTALVENHPVAEHVKKHGDGVKTLALWVDDAVYSYNTAISRGAKSAFEPKTLSDENGEVNFSSTYNYFLTDEDIKAMVDGFSK